MSVDKKTERKFEIVAMTRKELNGHALLLEEEQEEYENVIRKLKNTVEFWKTESTNQQALKEKERKKVEELQNELRIQWDRIRFVLNERDALQEERDHLLAANDEYQEKLRFEEEEEDPPICFKVDVHGNLSRVKGDAI